MIHDPSSDAPDAVFGPLLRGELARMIIEYRLSENAAERLEYLRKRANEGALSDDERDEYAGLVEDLDLLAVLRLKAERASQRAG